jgi:hypothetical protein
MDDNNKDINQLKIDLYSDKWETSLSAADRLSQLNTTISIDILIDGLSSTNSFIRNASALGIRETDSKKAFDTLFNRIKELGPNEEIGTLVYCLETANCNDYLIDLIDFYFNGNFEVKSSLTTIFNEQIFVLTKANIDRLQDILKLNNTTIQDFNLNITST